MLVAGLIEILLLLNKPTFTVRGLILVLLGVPVYFFWRSPPKALQSRENMGRPI
jgi:uncharacterized membrane protein